MHIIYSFSINKAYICAHTRIWAHVEQIYIDEKQKKGDVEANGFNNCPDKNTD